MAKKRSKIAALAVLLIPLALASGCAGSETRQMSGEAQSDAQAPAQAEGSGRTQAYTLADPGSGAAAGAGGEAEGKDGDALAAGTLLSAPGQQMMVVTGSISLVTKDPLAAADTIAAAAFAAGGRVDSRSESGAGATASASLTIRIPGSKTNQAIESIKKMGEADVQVGQEDVTTQAVDLDQRISALQASVDRMEQLIAKAATTSDILAVESKLTERQAELQSLKAQRESLSDQVALSTLDVTISAIPPSHPTPGPGPGRALADGWNAFVSFLTTVINALATALPFGVFFALIGAAIWLALKAWRKRHPRHRAAPAPSLPRPATGASSSPGKVHGQAAGTNDDGASSQDEEPAR